MIDLLAKIFIKDHKNYGDAKIREKYGLLCSVAAIVLNVLLAIAKFIVGTLAASLSITADAVNNLTDAGSSVLSFIGFKFSGKKPDPDHPFGHGRIEYVTSMAVSAIILIAGVNSFNSSVVSAYYRVANLISPDKFAAPETMEFSYVALAVLIMSIAVKFYMSYFMKKTGEKIDSTVMKATSADALGDTVSTAVTLACLLIFKFFKIDLDAFAGVFVSLVIIKAGIDSGKETLEKLLGSKPTKELVDGIKKTVMDEYPEVTGIHDMIIHDYGPGRFMVSLHAEMDGSGDIYEMHDVTDRIAMTLTHVYGCEAVVHLDPVDNKDETVIKYRKDIIEAVARVSEELEPHDVRVVPGHTHTNLIFDVVVPFKYKMTDSEVKAAISEEIKKIHPDCICAIMVDRPYI